MAKLSETKLPEDLGDFIKSNKALCSEKEDNSFNLEPVKDYFTKNFSSELDVAKFNDAKVRNTMAKQLDGVKYDSGKPRWDLLPIAFSFYRWSTGHYYYNFSKCPVSTDLP